MPDGRASTEFAERLWRLSETATFQAYRDARSAVLRLMDAQETTASDYWTEELQNFEYLLDASPLIIDKLRQHCYHITGVRPYEYRSGNQPLRGFIARRLEALDSLGLVRLRIPEGPELGGFGYEYEGGLYNLDTVKYYESLIAMERGGVLAGLAQTDQTVVIEVGGGWGGMAYQLKSLFPHIQYAIVDLPEVLLLSSTYLKAVFPMSTSAFFSGEAWPETDFVFIPHWKFSALPAKSIQLALNSVSFQEMTEDQVRQYVTGWASMGAERIYSLNRPRSVYNTQLRNVHSVLNEAFDIEAVRVLPVPYNEIARNPRSSREWAANALRRRTNSYVHHVGTRRP